MRHGLVARGTALVMSYVLTATTVWSAAPRVAPPPAVNVPLPALYPQRPAAGAPGEAVLATEPSAFLPEAYAFTLEPAALVPFAPAPMVEPSPSPAPVPGGNVGIFGPQRYVRTTGPKNVYTTTVAVPAWVSPPLTMHIQNGEPNGTYRVSSAWIEVNGTQVAAAPADFNQNVPALDRSIALAPQLALKVTLASKPTSYLSISLLGTNADHTAPQVAIEAPVAQSVIKETRPRLVVKYRDIVGSGEPAASGVDTATLKVTLDGVDRTSLFTRLSDEATADIPDALALAEGPHLLAATIKDLAGNPGQASADFRVDLTKPTIEVVDPTEGSYLPTLRPTIRVRYADDVGVDLARLSIAIDGSDRTHDFLVGPAEATATLDLAAGPRQVTATIKDKAGNAADTSRGFRLDVEAPTLTIDQPLAGSRLGLPEVEVLIHYRDDQGLDLATFKAFVDGTPIVLATGPEGASGTVHLGDAPQHVLAAEIKDRAGNLRNASSGFSVDTGAPFVRVVQPPPGQIIATATPHVSIEYSDPQGIDTATFKLWVGPSGARVDRTSWCVAAAAGAECTIPPANRLPEGDNVITGEIKDPTGNLGTADSRFKVDTVKPTGSLNAPANPTNVARPTIVFAYDGGAGTGIDAGSVHVFVDGADRTDRFLPGAAGVTGALLEALTEGEHTVRLEMADLAGNAAVVLGAFTVDTLPPSGSFTKPADDSFINDATPDLAIAYGDGTGTGVVPSQVKVFLQRGSDEWADVTSYFQRGADSAIGVVPDAAPLGDGTYHVRAEIQDAAGNAATIHASFQLDTVAPTYTIHAPANGAHLATRTPSFLVTYDDSASGVDKAKVALLVDGADVTSQLPPATATELGGTLVQPLAEGDHVVAVKVLDRAGNQAVIGPHVVTVDTVPPVVVIERPHDGDFLGDGQQLIRITYSDPNGDAPDGTIDPASVKVTVDRTDRTADFTAGDSRAEATLTLAHGPHTVNAELVDWAANPGAAGTTFFIDAQPPVVHIQSPAEGSFVPQAPVSVTGTLTDDDPTTTVECQGAGDPVTAIVNAGTFTCAVPLAQRVNVVKATAKDRFGRPGSDSRNVTLDTIAPVIAILQPPTGVATAGASIEVLGQVHDESAVTVVVGTTPAEVQGDSFHATVPLGPGPVEHIVATAADAAGHTSETFVDVTIDRLAPVVHITSPLSEAYLKGPTIDVHGTVSDASSVSVEVNQQPAAVSGPSTDATFSAVVPVVDGRIRIEATAHDAAANTGGDEVWVNVDSVPPAIVITQPAPGFVTRGASVHVAGTATDASSFTLKIEGQVVPVVNGAFAADIPLPAEGSRDITADAIDAAGNGGSVHVTITVDRTPPALDVVSPVEGAALGALPISVVGTVSDATPTTVTVDAQPATRTEQAWQAGVGGLPEGGHTFTVIATDAAGNETTVYRRVTIDLSPPVVHIITPADGTVTRDGTVTVTGQVEDRSAVTVVVSAGGPGQPAVVTGTGPFNFTGTVALADGDNTITATATDQTAQPGSALVRVTRDSIAPTIELVTPEKISRGRPGQATVVVTDNLGLGVTFTVKVDGSSLGSFTSSPAVVPLSVPAGQVAGDSFQVSVEAADAAGNPATAQRDVLVISDGVIVGQVLVDTTGLPLPGGTVHMTSMSGVETTTTDDRGRYSFPTGDVAAVLSIEKAGMTTVERELTIESGTGTIPVDARLTSLADARTIVPDGGSLTVGTLTLTIGAGAGGAYRFTPLSAQGLPALLPMGWSPLAAFHLSAPADSGVLSASATGLPALATHLVEYRTAIHDWVLVASTGTPADGALTFAVPGPGSFAIVAPDDDTILIPAAGDVIAGVPFELLPATATSKSVVTPATLPPSGGTARAALQVISPTPLPSGTVLQAQVKETFTLSSGEVASEEQRRQDIVLFAHPKPAEATLAAEIPITPSRTFATTELASGKVHLDILAGREGVRGKTGGLEAAQLDSGDVRLGLAKQSLAADTAVAVEQTVLSPFLPSSASLVPLGEVVVDFAGQRLAFAAELSLADPGVVAAGDTLLVARVERVDGIPRMVVVALAELSGGRVPTIPTPPLPGLREEGRYVFYRSAVPIGFVSGMVTPVAGHALVEMTGAGATPFVALTTADGHYLLAVAAGQVTVRARLLKTALAGQAQATVDAGQTAILDIALTGSVTTATVSPASGALVAPNSQLTLATDTALDPSKITAANIRLTKTGSVAAVDLRFVLSGSGKTLTIVPTPPAGSPENTVALTFSTDYTFEATGLKTVLGGDVLVPTVNFRTRDDTPPVYNSSALVFSFPDADGNVTVSAPPGTFPPGTQILIVNGTSGFVATFTAENDGAVGVVLPATMPATINDRFIVTVTDPLGNATTFNRSQFVDAAGHTAIGPGGGVVEGEGGVELRIPDGALGKGVTLKIEGLTTDQLEQLFPDQKPDFPGATLASGLKIESPDKPEFKKEVKLAFPLPSGVPANASDAFYYVYRRAMGPSGQVFFETIDHAFLECPAGQTTCTVDGKKVVTASYPFAGYTTSFGSFDATGAISAAVTNYAFLMWTFDGSLPGKALPGVITGKVLRTKWDPGATTPTFDPVANAVVRGQDAAKNDLAVSQKDGTFTLFDPRYTGGTVTIQATVNGETRTATAFEANPADWSTSGLRFYKNIASANITFPPVQPPPPPPDIQIRVMRLVNGARTDTGGLVVANTPLVIGFTAKNGDVRGATLQGADYGVRIDPLKGQSGGMDFVLDPDFTPAQSGSYTVTATALPAFGSPVTSSYTFRVLADGGGVDNLPNDPPAVITAKTVPKAGATGVPVATFVQVAFTEPVRRIPGNVRLLDASNAEVAIRISGIGPGPTVIDDLTSADSVLTSLTIQPLTGLRFSTTYRLVLSSRIEDLDKDASGNAAPKTLAPTESSFTTFGPVALTEPGTGETFTSPGIVVLGERAYLVQNNFFNGTLRAFDVTDPVSPREIESARAIVTWRPVDIAGEEETTISQGRLVTVATSSTNQSKPSNVYIFDTTSDLATRWIGAVSLTNSAIEGFINRIATRDGFLYAATARKGIQVVDLAQAKALFEPPGSADYFRMIQSFNTDGQGFGQQAVVQSIPVNDASGRALMMRDLKVGDFVVDGQPQPLVVASGDAPLVVVNPQVGQILARPALETAAGSKLTWGQAVAIGTINDTRIAVVVGAGTTAAGANTVLAVVNLNDPRSPQVMSILAITGITGSPTDVLLKGTLALVGTTKEVALVSLQDLSQPTMAGVLQNVAGRLALTSSNLLLGTARSVFGGTDPLGGVRTATLSNLALIEGTDPARIVVGEAAFRAAEPFRLRFRVVPAGFDIQTVRIEYRVGDVVAGQTGVTLADGRGELALPFGYTFPKLGNQIGQPVLVINGGTPDELVSAPKAWRTSAFEITLAGKDANDLQGDETPPLTAGADDGYIGDVMASNEELQLRKEQATAENPARPFSITWQNDGGVGVFPNAQQEEDGHFETYLEGLKVAGTGHRVRALAGDVVLGTSDALTVPPGPLPMLSGPGATITIQLPNSGVGADGVVPADGTTEVPLTIEVRDASNNLVLDGTPVACKTAGDGEVVAESEVVTAAGIARCTYRAGKALGTEKIGVEVDGVEAEKEVTKEVLNLSLTFDKPYVVVGEDIEATLVATTPSGDVPANGTPVGWLVLGARGTKDEALTGGQAKARFRFDREDLIKVSAFVAGAHALKDLAVVSQSTQLRARQSTRVLAGDLQADGVVPFPRFDGSTTDVPVKATQTITISGGVASQTVRLSLGTASGPNQLPESEYLMETLETGVMVDSYARHPGEVTGPVSLDTGDGRNSYRFAGGTVAIPAEGPLAQTAGLGLSLRVNPESTGTLIRRAGAFALSLVDSIGGYHVRLSTWNAGVEKALQSNVTLPAGAWSEISARFAGGNMTLALGDEELTQIVGLIDGGTGDLVVGESFTGKLDELRLFHTSGGSPPLLVITDGAGNEVQEATATFDSSGTAFFAVRSKGILDTVDNPSAFRPDGDSPLQAAIRAHFVGMRVSTEDGSYRSLGSLVLGKELAAALFVLAEAIGAGGGEDASSIGVTILDGVLGFTPVGAVTTVRDVAFALERIAQGTATGWDALTLTTVAVTLIASAVITKRFKAGGESLLALKSLQRMRKRAKALANMARWLQRAAHDEVLAQRLEATLKVLTQHGDDVTEATLDVLEVAEKNWRHMVYLEKTLKNAGEAAPEIIKALRPLAATPELLHTTLAVTRTAEQVTPKVVSAGTKIAKAVEAARAAKVSTPGIARLNNLIKNFSNPPLTREILERLDDIVDDSTQGVRFVVTQLGVLRQPGKVFIPDATEAVLRYALGKAKALGKRVAAFERKVEVPRTTGRQKVFHRQYDASFSLGGGRFLDIDVKNWSSFNPFSPKMAKEARKLQKDIVIKFLGDGNFDNLRWSIPQNLQQGSRGAIEAWMLKQFESQLVKNRIPNATRRAEALAEFKAALAKGLIEFF